MPASAVLLQASSVLVGVVSFLAVQRFLYPAAVPAAAEVVDISVPYTASLVAFDGDEGLGPGWMAQLSSVEAGDDFTTTRITLHSHYGTHVDAFKHIAPRGSPYDKRDAGVGDDIDSLDLQVLLGKALVVDVGDAPLIDAGVLEGLDIPEGIERVLFKTRNSRDGLMHETAFEESYVALDDTGAELVVARGIKVRPDVAAGRLRGAADERIAASRRSMSTRGDGGRAVSACLHPGERGASRTRSPGGGTAAHPPFLSWTSIRRVCPAPFAARTPVGVAGTHAAARHRDERMRSVPSRSSSGSITYRSPPSRT